MYSILKKESANHEEPLELNYITLKIIFWQMTPALTACGSEVKPTTCWQEWKNSKWKVTIETKLKVSSWALKQEQTAEEKQFHHFITVNESILYRTYTEHSLSLFPSLTGQGDRDTKVNSSGGKTNLLEEEQWSPSVTTGFQRTSKHKQKAQREARGSFWICSV